MGISGSLSLCGWWVSIVALLFVGLSHEDECVPSSCGDIHNIRYPFRLQHDPKHCGVPGFTLKCDKNITTLPLFSLEYHVKEINYTPFSYSSITIRVVDPGLEKNNCSSLPRFPLSRDDFVHQPNWWLQYDPNYSNSVVTLLKCANPVNDPRYVNTAPCIKSELFGYAIQNSMTLGDLENGCSIDSHVPTTLTDGDYQNVSYQYIHNQMVNGFILEGYFEKCNVSQWSYMYNHNGECYSRNIRGFFGLGWAVFTLNNLLEIICVASVVAVKFIFGAPFVIALLIFKWRRRHWSTYDTIEDFLQTDNFMPIRYSYSNLKKMSNGFKDMLGAGGFGSVFKCKLRSGHFGAIKLLGKSNANGEDFMSEVATIGRIHHVNVVQLVGYCVEGSKRALVYDFMPNGSLDKYIYSKEESISYKKMYEIVVGVAQGIEYLHQGCEMQILHFDIKPHNILLDENFIPKISDFGLAKLYPANNSIISTMAARGTVGYMAPELFYKNIGRVSYKADVYSFGMLLMEMASRRKNLNAYADHPSQIYFPSWVHDQYHDGKDLEIGDATAEEQKLIKKMIITALWCIQMKPNDRPSMKRIAQMLAGDVQDLEMPPKPFLCPQQMPERPQQTPVNNLIPVFSNVELTCTLSGR